MLTKDRSFYRSFFILTVTLMLEQAVVLSVNLADNIMLGSYSETALSGVAAVNQIQFVLQQLVFGISNGMVILSSQYWGQKRTEPIRRLMSVAMLCAVVVIAALFIYVSVFPRFAVSIFSADEAIISEGMAYLDIVRFSYPFFAITTVLLAGMRSVEKVKIALYVSAIALVINCSINYALITGNFGFPEMGVRGAAIGTLTARIVECVIVAAYMRYGDKLLCFRAKDLLRLDRSLFRDYIRVSIPVLLCSLLWGFNTALQTIILGHMSSSAIAAHSISSTVFLFLKVTSVGSATSASILIGKAVGRSAADGRGDMRQIKEYSRTLQVLFIGVGIVTGSILFLIRRPLLDLYALSAETRSLADSFMIIEATVLVFMSYQMCTNSGIIRGGGNTRLVMAIDATAILGMVIPLSLLAAFVWKFPPVAVLIVLNSDQYLKCIPAAICANRYKWVRPLTRSADPES